MSELLSVPIWAYREAAQHRARRDRISPGKALRDMLLCPVRIRYEGEPIDILTPVESIRESGVSIDEYLDSQTMLHEAGFIRWDARERVHVLVTPGNPS